MDRAMSVTVTHDGRLLRPDGSVVVSPGLEPETVRQALDEAAAGLLRPLDEVIRERDEATHAPTPPLSPSAAGV